MDPLQPAVRIIRLINELTPVQGSVDLLARYFNERSSEISCACRAFVVAHLMQSSVAGVESIICEADKIEFKRRRELYLATGEASQPSATLIAEGVWAAFWHAWSVYPRTVSSLLRPVELAEVVGQLRDIKANIAEIIPRLPRHQYYISLINGVKREFCARKSHKKNSNRWWRQCGLDVPLLWSVCLVTVISALFWLNPKRLEP